MEAPASPERAWALWSDPLAWPSFYPGLEAVQAPAGFKVGGKLALLPSRGGRAQGYDILAVEAGRAFTLFRRLPFATLKLQHRVEPCELGCRLHLRVEVAGPLGWLYRLILGRSWKASVPPLLRALAKAAQRP